jgi:hypothetical protein
MADIFDEALIVSTQENPLTAPAAGKMITMTLERHATVKAVSVAPSRGGGAAGARAGRHSRFGADDPFGGGFGASTELEPEPEEEEDESGGDVEYDDPGEISVKVRCGGSPRILQKARAPTQGPSGTATTVVRHSGGEHNHETMDKCGPKGTTQRMGSGWLGWYGRREREGTLLASPGAQGSHQ